LAGFQEVRTKSEREEKHHYIHGYHHHSEGNDLEIQVSLEVKSEQKRRSRIKTKRSSHNSKQGWKTATGSSFPAGSKENDVLRSELTLAKDKANSQADWKLAAKGTAQP